MSPLRGMSLIDVVVGSALVLIIFVGLFGILRASLQIAGLSKLKATATEVATSQIEYIRSLEYGDIGTVGGIPVGIIPQTTTATNGGLTYSVRTYIEYADDPKDGSGAGDTNGIPTDYKRVKVSVTYVASGVTRDVTLVTNAVPKGIESTAGGGTLQVNVVNAVGGPVSGATVRIRNSSTSPTIDLSTFSDTTGIVFLPGAPTSTEYRVNVSKTGYSSAQTYVRDATNQNPTPGYLTIVGGSTTSGTFAIDLLATLIVRTFSPIAAALWSDAFADTSKLDALTNTQVVGGSVTLSGTPGTYVPSGSARSNAVAPVYLASWTSASSTSLVVPGTNLRISIADQTGALLPDGVLPGNSSGFTGTINLSGLATTTYPSLALVAQLSSSNPLTTPLLNDWKIGYNEGPVPLPNIAFTLTGGKTTGTTGGGAPIYKTTLATSTGATASTTMSLEWDSYQISIPNYIIQSEEPESPYDLLPGATLDARLILTPQ